MERQWPLHVCPKCGSGEVDRAPRVRTLDRLAVTIADEEDGRPYAGKIKLLAEAYRMTT